MCAIWEGTTNILSLDVLRAVQKSKGAVLTHFSDEITQLLQPAKNCGELEFSSVKVEQSLQDVLTLATKMSADKLAMSAREFAYSLAQNYMGRSFL